MANRYWVGGSATWDATAGTKWATTSGGVGGAAVPTAADDVFFDAASGAVTVTMGVSPNIKSLDYTGFTGTLVGAAATIILHGTVCKFVSGMILSGSLSLTFNGNGVTTTLTSASKTFVNIVIQNASGLSLADALFNTGSLTFSSGTFITNNQSWTSLTFSSNNSNTRTVTLGSSAVTLTQAGVAWDTRTNAGITVNAGTSTITLTGGGSPQFLAGSTQAFNNVVFPMSASNTPIVGIVASIVNLTVTGGAGKTGTLSLNSDLTITGTFTVNGNSAVNRVLVQSSAIGTTRIITAAAVSMSNVDFMDILGAGAASWNLSTITGGSGDCGGNSGITFKAATTRYGVVAGNWSNIATWSASSGGSGGASIPLPQDTVILDANSAAGTYTLDMPRAGKDINFAGFTRSFTQSVASSVFGSWTFSTTTTRGAVNTLTFAGRGTHTITMAGQTWGSTPTIQAPGGTYTLQDSFTSSNGLSVNDGTLVTNDQALSFPTFAATSGRAATITLGSSTISLTSTSLTAVFSTNGAGTFVSVNTATVVIATASVNGRSIGRNGANINDPYAVQYTVPDSPGYLQLGTSSAASGSYSLNTLNVGPGREVRTFVGATVNVLNPTLSAEVRDYVYLPGVSGSYISTPDAAANSITSAITVEGKIRATAWTSAPSTSAVNVIAAKDDGSTQREWQFRWDPPTKKLQWLWWDSGGTLHTHTSTVAFTTADGADMWARATFTAATGTTRFWTSPDGSTWTQLGVAVVFGATTMRDQTAPVLLGSGPTNDRYWAGRIYNFKLYNSDLGNGSGTPVQSFDANAQVTTQDTWTNPTTGEVWTLNGLAAQGDGRITIDTTTAGTAATLSKQYSGASGNVWSFFGTARAVAGYLNLDGASGSYASTPDSEALSITGDLDLRVLCSLDDWTPAAQRTLLAKEQTTTARSYRICVNVTDGKLLLVLSADGSVTTQATSSVAPAVADGAKLWVRATWRQSDGRVQFFTAPGTVDVPVAADFTQLGTNQTIAIASIFDSTSVVELGSRIAGTADLWAGKFYKAEVRNGIDGTVVASPDFTINPGVHTKYVTAKDISFIGDGVWNLRRSRVVSNVVGANVAMSADLVKSGGIFQVKPTKVKVGGVMVEKPVYVKSGGQWVP